MPSSASRGEQHRRASAHSRALTAIRRQEILEAAVKVLNRKGFEAARAEDIAHTARIAKGTLYLYFRSKEAVYSAAIAHAVQELQTLSSERIEAATGFRQKLAAAIAVRLHFWTEHQPLYRLLLTLGRESRYRKQTNDLMKSGQEHLLRIFAEGIAANELKAKDYAALAWAILDMIRGATERRMDRVSLTAIDEDALAVTAIALAASGIREPISS